MKLPPTVLALVLACLPTGCADYNSTMRMAKNKDVHGITYAQWLECKPATWVPGPDPRVGGHNEKDRGNLYIDFQKRQASGEGVQFLSDGEVQWKITGMRVVTMGATPSELNPLRATKLVVFDGDFRVKVPNGQVYHSSAAIDRFGPGLGGKFTHQLSLLIAPPGVLLRDGVEVDGMVTAGSLLFH